MNNIPNINQNCDMNEISNCDMNESSKDFDNYKNGNTINQSQTLGEVTQINDISNQKDIVNENQIKEIQKIEINKETSSKKKVKSKFSYSAPISNETNINSTNYKTTLLAKKLKKNKYKKKFPNGKFGPIPNINKANRKYIKNNDDNLKKKIFTHCVTSIHIFVKKYIRNKKYKIKLYKPTITHQIGEKKDIDLKSLSEKSIKDIYLDFKPKHSSKDYNKKLEKIIEKILQKENQNEGIKLLNIIFNKKLKDFLIIYLNDYRYINDYEHYIEGEFLLKQFKTYKDDFDDIKPNKKERNKENVLNMLDNNE